VTSQSARTCADRTSRLSEQLGKKPKQFRDFEYLYIETYQGKDGHLTGNAVIGSKSEKDFFYQSAVFLLVTEKRLVLVTEPTGLGFEYRFDGEFLRGGVLADAGEGKAVISGRLTKTKNGRRIAERVVKFQVEQHGF
jgi:hypothetical protein